MLFTCPGTVARGGGAKGSRQKGRQPCVDIHCHVHFPLADDMVKNVFKREDEPGFKFANSLTRETNRKHQENVRICLTSVEQRLRDMDKMGIEIQALSCSPGQFMYSLDAKWGRKVARAVNENLAAIVERHPDRFVALANVPLQAPDVAAEELQYCVRKLGFRGVEIGTNVAGQEISRGRDKFWSTVQKLGVMVFLHPNGFTEGARFSDHYFGNAIGMPLDTTVALSHLVFDGVLERFPKLRIVAAHGGGFASHYPGRFDHVWKARADARTVLKKKPSKSFAQLYFDTLVFDREQLRHLVNLWGVDRILTGTDYPFDMGWYDPRGFVEGCNFLSRTDKGKILGANAAKLLRIRLPR